MKKYSPLAVIIVILLTSCVVSLYPLTEKTGNMVFNKELLGHWKEKDGSAEYIIDTLGGSNGKTYRMQLIDTDFNKGTSDTSHMLVTLVKVKENYFLDCVPNINQPGFSKIDSFSMWAFLPSHYIIKIDSISKNSVVVAAMDKDTLSSLINKKKINIRHEVIDKDHILLLEKPARLQQKLIELEKFPSAYPDRSTLIRIK